jgi:aryl-alcohol dehydrogenase-like predicted oxidoreductase
MVPGALLPRNFKVRNPVAAEQRSLRRLGTDPIGLYHQLHRCYPTIPIEEPMNVLGGLTLYAKGRPSM